MLNADEVSAKLIELEDGFLRSNLRLKEEPNEVW